MNHKKILRLMSKFNFFAKVRQANPYRTIAKATEVHRTVLNHLNQDFKQDEPGKVFLPILLICKSKVVKRLIYPA